MDFMQLQSNPLYQMGLAGIRGRPQQEGLEIARDWQAYNAKQNAQAQREQISQALRGIDTAGMPAHIQQIMQIDPVTGIELWNDYKASMPKPQSTVGKIQADLEGGLIDEQTAIAAIKKATTGNMDLLVDPNTGERLVDYGDGTFGAAQPRSAEAQPALPGQSYEQPAFDQYQADSGVLPAVPEMIPDTNVSDDRYAIQPAPPEMNTPVLQRQWLESETKRVAELRAGDAKAEGERAAESKKALTRYKSAIAQLDDSIALIDQEMPNVGYDTVGLYGSYASRIPGTDATDFQEAIDPLRARTAFSELKKMREESPTGGALGGIAVRELELLQNTQRSLSNSQSPDQFKRNLKAYKDQLEKTKSALREAYERDYGGLQPDTGDIDLSTARRAPDGNLYVEQNGQYYRVEE